MIDLTDIDLAELRLQADKIVLAGGNAQTLHTLIDAYEDLPGAEDDQAELERLQTDYADAERSLEESAREIAALKQAAHAPLTVKKHVKLPHETRQKQMISVEFIAALREDIRALAAAHPERGYLNHAVDEFWDSYATLYSRANRKAGTP